MDAALAQLVGYGIGGASNVGTGLMNYFSQRETNRFNRELVNQQNQWNIQQWNRENAYNSPVNVMMRLRAAGLNPSLMYEGGAGQLSSAPSPTMQSSRDVAPQMTGMPTMSDFVSLSSAMSQSKLMQAQADYYKSLGQTEDELRSERLNALILSNKNTAKQTDELVERIKAYADQHKLSEEQIKSMQFDRVMQGKQFLLDKKRLAMDEKMTDKQIQKLDADIRKIIAEKNVTEREYQEMVWTFSIRKAGLANQVNLSAAQIEQAKATSRKLGIDADIDAPMAAYRSQDLRESLDSNGNLTINAAVRYALYSLIDNFGRIIH